MSHLTLVKESIKPVIKFDRHIEKKRFKIGDRVRLNPYCEDHVIAYVNKLKNNQKIKNNMCSTGTIAFCSFEQDKGKNNYYVNIWYWVQMDNGRLCQMNNNEIIKLNQRN